MSDFGADGDQDMVEIAHPYTEPIPTLRKKEKKKDKGKKEKPRWRKRGGKSEVALEYTRWNTISEDKMVQNMDVDNVCVFYAGFHADFGLLNPHNVMPMYSALI